MARSLLTAILAIARAQEREKVRLLKAQDRERSSIAKERERVSKQTHRSKQQALADEISATVEDLNQVTNETIRALEHMLVDALAKPVGLNWQAMQKLVDERELKKHPDWHISDAPEFASFEPRSPGILGRILPGWRDENDRKIAKASEDFAIAKRSHEIALRKRQSLINAAQAEADTHNRDILGFYESYRSGVPESVSGYFDIIFEGSDYPDGFPQKWRSVYLRESKQLIVDFDLPNIDGVVPAVEKFRYVKAGNKITETKRTPKSRQALYTSIVAQTVLRRLYEVFQSDRAMVVDVAVINAFVEAIDTGTGQRVRPCLVSVRTTRDEFLKLDLRQVDPAACLRRLNASVSRSPTELAAVKPILDLDMADSRFVQESDVISTLDTRPNLMDLTPGEFESLIANLFQRMGLETKQTQASRDGGVDCIAFDPRPVLGGKVIVQAKRYKNTVGVSAVRDLFGTMHNEGASKGILVTTSGYGKAAFEFANGKPLELLSGSNLLYMLKEHAGIEAKIIMPDEWRDGGFDN